MDPVSKTRSDIASFTSQQTTALILQACDRCTRASSGEGSHSDGPPRGSVRGAQRQFLHSCQLAQYRIRSVQALCHSWSTTYSTTRGQRTTRGQLPRALTNAFALPGAHHRLGVTDLLAMVASGYIYVKLHFTAGQVYPHTNYLNSWMP